MASTVKCLSGRAHKGRPAAGVRHDSTVGFTRRFVGTVTVHIQRSGGIRSPVVEESASGSEAMVA